MDKRVAIQIQHKTIGDGHPCFIIAEAGINHNGDEKLALEMIVEARSAGADAVKFQTHLPEHEMLSGGAVAAYVGESLFDLLKRVSLSFEAHKRLLAHARANNIIFLSTPFSREAADFLETLPVSAFKIGSGELTNLPLQEHIARKNKPMIISAGMATSDEVEATLGRIRGINQELALMHCTSTYPTPYEHANLNVLPLLKSKYNLPVGLSDHTLGTAVSIAAAALGANLIEKHFTLSRDLEGPDQKASLEPAEFRDLVQSIRAVEKALGDGIKKIQPGEDEVRRMAQHSVVSLRDIPRGNTILADDVWVKRPGTGISARHLSAIIGRRALRFIPKDRLLDWKDLEVR